MKSSHAPKFEFLTTRAKNRIYGYGAKSRLGYPRVPIGEKKWVKTVKNCHAPKFEFLTTPRSSIWAKNRIYGYGAKSRLGPLGYILRPMGSIWGQKVGQNRQKITMPENSNIWLLRGHQFGQKIEFTVMAPNHSGDTLGFPLGLKKGSKPLKIAMPQNSNFLLLRGHRFGQKIEFTVMARNHCWDPLGSILGPMGSHWGIKNWSKNTMPQNSNFWPLRTIFDLGKKLNLWLWRQITVGTP